MIPWKSTHLHNMYPVVPPTDRYVSRLKHGFRNEKSAYLLPS